MGATLDVSLRAGTKTSERAYEVDAKGLTENAHADAPKHGSVGVG